MEDIDLAFTSAWEWRFLLKYLHFKVSQNHNWLVDMTTDAPSSLVERLLGTTTCSDAVPLDTTTDHHLHDVGRIVQTVHEELTELKRHIVHAEGSRNVSSQRH